MSNFTPYAMTLLLSTAALTLSACITVAPDTPIGKVATQASGVAKVIKPTSKPTMLLPASHTPSQTISQTELSLACEGDQTGRKRIMIIDESGQTVIKDTSVNCSQYHPASTAQPAAMPQGYSTASVSAPVTTTRQVYAAPTSQAYVAPLNPSPVVQSASTAMAPVAARTQSQHSFAPTTSYGQYTVRTGDNLYAISKRHCLTVEQISAANGIYAPYTIKPGQILTLPQVSC